nr:MAG TPA: protein of unknown function (DUF5336) [Caudoviricetes sp.]
MTHQAPAPQAPQEPQQPQQGEQLPQQQAFPQYQPQPQGYAQRPIPVADAGPTATKPFERHQTIAILIANLGLVVFILGLLAIFTGNGVDDLAIGLTMTGGSLAVMLLAGIWNTLATIGYNLAVSQQLRQR